MNISMYEASVPVFIHTLESLKTILQKGLAHAEAKKFDPAALTESRLFPDMLPLKRQVQISSDAAKGAAARLAGIEPPKFEDNEKTFPELIARVDKTIAFLQGLTAAQIDGSEQRAITVPTQGGTLTLSGLIFLRHRSIPNLFFHVTTAYGILRHNGVELGKSDFLGELRG